MHEIQDAALTLFERDGYRDVSVEQVAAAAGVSPSTVYRYFGTKEMLVVWDDIDPRVVEMINSHDSAEPMDPDELIAAIATAARFMIFMLTGAGDEVAIKRRMRLMVDEPEIRAGQVRQIQSVAEQIQTILAVRLGPDYGDLLPRVLAAQGVWGVMAAFEHWVANDFAETLSDLMDRTINILQPALQASVHHAVGNGPTQPATQ